MRGFSFRLRPGFLRAELVAFWGVFLCSEVPFFVRSKDSVNIGICVSFFISLCFRACVLCGRIACLLSGGICPIARVRFYFRLFSRMESVFCLYLRIE